LNKFEGLSYQEIADTMDMSVKAVKSLLSRARVNLRLLLQPYIEEGVPPNEASQGLSPEGHSESSEENAD
jgi:RNA polymerase sigma-70 factor (ECF subfamily)